VTDHLQPLTKKQSKFFALLQSEEPGISLDELCAKTGFRSTNAVRHYLRTLERKGYLQPNPLGLHRRIRLTEKALIAA
jgi:DNA-binding IclR family transcriptional regulator